MNDQLISPNDTTNPGLKKPHLDMVGMNFSALDAARNTIFYGAHRFLPQTKQITLEAFFMTGAGGASTDCLLARYPTLAGGVQFAIANRYPHVYLQGDYSATASLLQSITPAEYSGTTPALADYTWHHAAVTSDQNFISLYIDGLLVFSKTDPGDWTAMRYPDSGEYLSVGSFSRYCTRNTGFVPLVKVYSRMLSAPEIAESYDDPFCFLDIQRPARRYWIVPPMPPTGTFLPAWAARQSSIIGGR